MNGPNYEVPHCGTSPQPIRIPLLLLLLLLLLQLLLFNKIFLCIHRYPRLKDSGFFFHGSEEILLRKLSRG